MSHSSYSSAAQDLKYRLIDYPIVAWETRKATQLLIDIKQVIDRVCEVTTPLLFLCYAVSDTLCKSDSIPELQRTADVII